MQTKEQSVHSATYLWHCRFGHINISALQQCQQLKRIKGLPEKGFKAIFICESCLFGKMSHQRFAKSKTVTEFPLQLVHTDLCGPLPIPSLSRARYSISFIDNTTRFTVVNFLKQKSDAFAAFYKYKQLAENQTSRTIKKVRSDNGGEYVSQEWENFFDNNGITHQKIVPYTPQQNGIAERKNRTLLIVARSLLKMGQMKQQFWEDAISTTCYLQNRSPHTALQGQIPFILWYDDIPNVSHLKIFGAAAYVYVNPHHRSKLDDNASEDGSLGMGSKMVSKHTKYSTRKQVKQFTVG